MVIAFRPDWYARALEEQRLRAPHMMTKFAYNDVRVAGQIRGLVIEHHVSGWFQEHYPQHYLEPDNYGQWDKVCSHDFKLKTPEKVLYLDVSGPRKDGSFGAYEYKPRAGVDFHILCKPLGFVRWDQCDYHKGFEIVGVVKPEHYRAAIFTEHIILFASWLKSIGL